ncbi:MAG TPA: histidinol-phosphate transaminase [Ignavibacteriaceae bacterium]|nr:histidinol-phosphate transaminase [Ignavibacteriaceae bacterium]
MDINKLVRKNILELKPYTSARDIYEGDGILLDANENSFGSTFTKIEGLKLNRYPDPHQNDLREIVSNYLLISQENLFFGVGSDEIIDLLIRIFCEPGIDNVIIPEPTYGMYKVACDINNVETKSVLLTDKFQIDFNEIEKVYNSSSKIIFLCSPNNPTGNLINKADIARLCEKYNSMIVVDEAYIDFSIKGALIDQLKKYNNLVILRTFSKAWGLAGIRLGYCMADSELIKILFKVKAPYNISTLTRYVLTKAFVNSSVKDEYIQSIIAERKRLKYQLETLRGIENVFDSDANFLLIKCNNPIEVQNKLIDKGIIVRDRSNQPQLGGCLRISIGSKAENDLLWDAIKNIL